VWWLGLLRRAVGSFRNKEAARAMGRWRDAHAEALLRKQRRQIMEVALRRVKQRDLTRGCLAWTDYTAYMHEGQRLLRVAARASAKIKQPRLVAAMDSWKAQARLWDAFGQDQPGRGGMGPGMGASFARCVAQCLGKVVSGARKAAPLPQSSMGTQELPVKQQNAALGSPQPPSPGANEAGEASNGDQYGKVEVVQSPGVPKWMIENEMAV
jgi:hypothetical protein